MNTDHYRINVAVPIECLTVYPGTRYQHLFYAVVDAIGVKREEKAKAVAATLQVAYPAAKISITLWESRGKEVHI